MGYRVGLGATPEHLSSLEYWSRDLLGPLETVAEVCLSDLAPTRAALSPHADLLIVDIGSRVMFSDLILTEMDLHHIDLALIPVAPVGKFDFLPAQMAARALQAHGFPRFMLQPFVNRIALSLLMTNGSLVDGLREFQSQVSDALIVQRSHVEPPRLWHAGSASGFQDDDLESEYVGVLYQVLLRLGVDQHHIELQERDFEKLSMAALLRMLAPAVRAGRMNRRLADGKPIYLSQRQ